MTKINPPEKIISGKQRRSSDLGFSLGRDI